MSIASPQTIKRSDALVNRQRIVEAARQVFAEQGVQADIKDIAERAGLGVGTIYRNFPGKDDLLIEVCRILAGDVAAALSEGEDEENPLDGIRVSILNMYRVASQYGWVMHAKINQQLPPDVQKQLRPPHQDPRYQAVYRMIARASEQGLIRPGLDPRTVVVLLFATIWPLMHHNDPDHPRTGEQLADMVLDVVFNGALPR